MKSDKANFMKTIKELIDVNAMLGAGSPEHPDGDNAFSPDGKIINHAYSILDIQEYSD